MLRTRWTALGILHYQRGSWGDLGLKDEANWLWQMLGYPFITLYLAMTVSAGLVAGALEEMKRGIRNHACPEAVYSSEWKPIPWKPRLKQDWALHIIQRWRPTELAELWEQRGHCRLECRPQPPFLQASCRCCPSRHLSQPPCSVWLLGFGGS